MKVKGRVLSIGVWRGNEKFTEIEVDDARFLNAHDVLHLPGHQFDPGTIVDIEVTADGGRKR